MNFEYYVRLFNSGLNSSVNNFFMMNEDEIAEALLLDWDYNIAAIENDLDNIILGIEAKGKSMCLTKAMYYFDIIYRERDIDIQNNDEMLMIDYYEKFKIQCMINSLSCCFVAANNWLLAFDFVFLGIPEDEEIPDSPTPLKEGINYMAISGDGIENSIFKIY